jgi:hypothetical protein
MEHGICDSRTFERFWKRKQTKKAVAEDGLRQSHLDDAHGPNNFLSAKNDAGLKDTVQDHPEESMSHVFIILPICRSHKFCPMSTLCIQLRNFRAPRHRDHRQQRRENK